MKAGATAAAQAEQDIQEIVGQHPGEWLAIAVRAEEAGQPKTGRLVCHAKNRQEVWRKTRSWRRLFIVYAGPALKEGYAAAF